MDYLKTRKDDELALFISFRNNRLQPGGIRDIFHRLEKCGVDDIHPHKFRRTLATDLLNAGMHIQDVAIILGHSNVKTTQIYYAHNNKRIKNEFHNFVE